MYMIIVNARFVCASERKLLIYNYWNQYLWNKSCVVCTFQKGISSFMINEINNRYKTFFNCLHYYVTYNDIFRK